MSGSTDYDRTSRLLRPVDFITQERFSQPDFTLPEDSLGHTSRGSQIVQAIETLPGGSVIGVQAPWGRGKTDLLARLAHRTWSSKPPGTLAPDALWINPWQYGGSDLLTPLAARLAERRKASTSSLPPDFRKYLGIVVRAGVSFSMSAAALVAPMGELIGAGKGPIDDLLKALFEEKKAPAGVAEIVDPVARAGEAFRKLIEEVLSAEQREAGVRLLICVDDLDRCLPDRQVAMLQAIRHLVSAGAPATFVIALDPALAIESLKVVYKGSAFDGKRFLDKLFDFRINLPALSPADTQKLTEDLMAATIRWRGEDGVEVWDAWCDAIGSAPRRRHALEGAFSLRALRNPRIIRRAFDRLVLLCVALTDPSEEKNAPAALARALDFRSAATSKLLLLWLGATERWPELQRFLRADGDGAWKDRLDALTAWYAEPPGELPGGSIGLAARALLPEPGAQEGIEMQELFDALTEFDTDQLRPIDALFRAAGI